MKKQNGSNPYATNGFSVKAPKKPKDEPKARTIKSDSDLRSKK